MYYVRITTIACGLRCVEYVGKRGAKTMKSFGSRVFKTKKIEGWKTITGARKYVDSVKALDGIFSCDRTYEIVGTIA